MAGRQIAILDSGIESHQPGSPLYKNREQAIVLYTPDQEEGVTVIHPNEDGSYWRKIVRNKVGLLSEDESCAIIFTSYLPDLVFLSFEFKFI